jgi:hypothetical protein
VEVADPVVDRLGTHDVHLPLCVVDPICDQERLQVGRAHLCQQAVIAALRAWNYLCASPFKRIGLEERGDRFAEPVELPPRE